MKPEDIRKLNRIKTYIVLQQGKSKISKLIQKYSKEYCRNQEFIPTHLLMFKFRFGKWWVYESTHSPVDEYLINGGVRHYEADIWLELEKDNLDQYRFYEVDLDYYSMEKYIGQPYGYGDIKQLMLASIRHSNGLQKDYKGLICSEYGALCCKEVRDFYGELPAWCITPAHFQNMFNIKGQKVII